MKKRLFNIVKVVLFIIVLGLMGRIELNDEINTSKIDSSNKIEVIKDIQIKCINGTITDKEYCSAYLK